MGRRVITVVIVLLLAYGGVAAILGTHSTPDLGLDLKGGTSVILRAPDGTDPDVLAKAVEIMRGRIEAFGVQEPEISISGKNGVLVQLPGVTDRERALEAIGQTGVLSFRPVIESSFQSPLLDAVVPTTTTAAGDVTIPTEPTTTSTLPPTVDPSTGYTVTDDPTLADAWLPELGPDGQVIAGYHVGTLTNPETGEPDPLTGSDLTEALANFGSNGQWQVNLRLNDDGARKFQEITRDAAQFPIGDARRQIAIVLDGKVISSPQVAETVDPNLGIAGGTAVITLGAGDNQQTEAQDLAVVLRYGSLPIAFERDQVQSVSATLGSDSLHSGLVAGLAGLILVAIYMILYYRSLGVVTIIGLSVFGSLMLIVLGLLGKTSGLTLTLAGVTGIVVSVGITADSYIVFYERIKEELHRGRTMRAAVDEGFSRAFHTILTADTVSILAAVLLWLLAVGPVKGFAITLGIATFLDVLVAYFFTRNAVAAISHGPLGEGGIFSIRAAAGGVQEAS
ncbi:MAG TPA: protein translocase subunit SecD [Acidimicrobiia bacterium]|nr:protein translocase subunit SecD [Acidimicrobiia bacterium]